MSGHSKWNNIKRKKEKTDGQRAKIFTKIGRELAVAVKEGGGPDPASNSKLKDAIAKAKANNVPNDNIERIIKKAAARMPRTTRRSSTRATARRASPSLWKPSPITGTAPPARCGTTSISAAATWGRPAV